jgi:glyoxylate/hydroxypyruvate reductase A
MGWARTAREIPGVEVFHGEDGFNAMLSQTDIAVVLLPLTSSTRGLIAPGVLAQMPKSAGLINFGRGPVVQTDALVDALDNDHLSHAVLDVFDEEPLATGSALWGHPKVTVLPHISAPTGRASAAAIAGQAVAAFFETGQTPALVDRTRGY